MKKDKNVSLSVINRLPRYHRFLRELLDKGITRISSGELAQLMRVTASQIRQDLNCFGGFGQQGYGYNVELLFNEISDILGSANQTPAILIGAGNLGKTIASQIQLKHRGFKLVAAFDNNEELVGTQLVGLTIKHIDDLDAFYQTHQPKIAVICVPKFAAATLGDKLVKLGVKGFWNFSSADFSLAHDDIDVVNVHLGDSLLTLSYLVSHRENEDSEN